MDIFKRRYESRLRRRLNRGFSSDSEVEMLMNSITDYSEAFRNRIRISDIYQESQEE